MFMHSPDDALIVRISVIFLCFLWNLTVFLIISIIYIFFWGGTLTDHSSCVIYNVSSPTIIYLHYIHKIFYSTSFNVLFSTILKSLFRKLKSWQSAGLGWCLIMHLLSNFFVAFSCYISIRGYVHMGELNIQLVYAFGMHYLLDLWNFWLING